MILSLALVFLGGLSAAALLRRIGLPPVIGMLAAGIIIGPNALNLLDTSVIEISSDLRRIALIIILLRAGLSLNVSDFKKVGRPAVLLSFVPAVFETAAYVLLAPPLLGMSRIEAAVLGAVLAAVSPAIVVPRMLKLIKEGYGTNKCIPQMLMAGASCDDVFVIVLFSAFTGMAQSGTVNAAKFADVPVSIALGIAAGIGCGAFLALLLNKAHERGKGINDSTIQAVIMFGIAFLLASIENAAEKHVAFSGLLAVMSMACIFKMKSPKRVTEELARILEKTWTAAEIVLFVLVGAAVDVKSTAAVGAGAICVIVGALVMRSVGVLICLIGSGLNAKEKLFCTVAYIPKATVQAAIGSMPLAMGLPCGNTVLAVAVLGILITAPLGAAAVDRTYDKLLKGSGDAS